MWPGRWNWSHCPPICDSLLSNSLLSSGKQVCVELETRQPFWVANGIRIALSPAHPFELPPHSTLPAPFN